MEVFKDIVGYEGLYQVSNFGRVKSLERVEWCKRNDSTRVRKERILKPVLINNGYVRTVLYKDSKPTPISIHRLVATTFLPNPENKETVNHIDGVKTNNKLENLEWATITENIRHAFAVGLNKGGNPNKNGKLQGSLIVGSRLTEEKVKYARLHSRIYGGEMMNAELAEMFGVTKSAINTAVSGKTWKHIHCPNETSKVPIPSETGFKYVSVSGNRFQGAFSFQKKKYYCGSHVTPEEAYDAVMIKRKEVGL